MKRRVIFLTLMAASSFAMAQAKPAAKEAAKPAAEKPAAEKQASAKPVAAKAKRSADARHCLTQPSNTAIIKCAEAYL